MWSDTNLDTPLKIKKECTLPWEREDGQQAIEILDYEEEPTEVDEPLEKYEDKAQTPLSVTIADDRRRVRRILPWIREDAQEVIEVLSDDEEPTEEDEPIENSEDEDKPIRVITVDASNMKYVRRITAKQRPKTQQPQPLASATNIKSTMSSSMESDYFSCSSTPLKRKKPRYTHSLFSVLYIHTYTNGCRILSELY